MDKIPSLSRTERLILDLLIEEGEMYGLEMVKKSDGKLKRGTVYVTLQRMAEKGYVDSIQVKLPGESGLPKRIFKITGLGKRVLRLTQMLLEEVGKFAYQR